MTETVQIALITFLTSLVSATIGAFASFKISASSTSAESSKQLYIQKAQAYSNFLSAYHAVMSLAISGQRDSLSDSLNKFAEAYSMAGILAPESVTSDLSKLFDITASRIENRITTDKVGEQYCIVQNALRDDLEKTRPK